METFGEIAGSRHVLFGSRFFNGHAFDGVALGKGDKEKGNDHVMIGLADRRQIGSQVHACAPGKIMLLAGVKCPLSLRGVGTTSELVVREEKIIEVSSGGG